MQLFPRQSVDVSQHVFLIEETGTSKDEMEHPRPEKVGLPALGSARLNAAPIRQRGASSKEQGTRVGIFGLVLCKGRTVVLDSISVSVSPLASTHMV